MRVLLLGTSSDAGKTVIGAMVCRHMAREGLDPAPFKAFNLSLNSYATKDGGEIGMGQTFQAWACGLEPETDMNPVLYKPSGGGRMQMIVGGRPLMDIGNGVEADREAALRGIGEAFDRLSSEHGCLVCEGSGSPAELNLMSSDLANTGLMRLRHVPAVLVADIERGGVFAAIYGTWRLIPDDVRPLLRGFIINRFRGDPSILSGGIERIEELTGMRCLGVVPRLPLRFPEEDSLSRSEGKLEGDDVRQAFLSNLDELLEAAEEDGFDFALLESIARGRCRSGPHGPVARPTGDDTINYRRVNGLALHLGRRWLPDGLGGLPVNSDYKRFIESKAKECESIDSFPPELYEKYDVKKGLRDSKGNGVVVGLTSISQVDGTEKVDGKKVPCEGKLRYRGYDIVDLTQGFLNKRFGFEECTYLLLFGDLPTASELEEFKLHLSEERRLPVTFTRDVIMKAANKDIMNSISRCILFLSSYDKNALDNSTKNVLRQCIYLISVFPMLTVYSYHAYNHYINDESMYIHRPDPRLSTAENFLRMLRPDKSYTYLEATVLDLALVLHMEHGGGNNSTFTTRVTTSSGSDTYAVIAAAMSSLKGPKHGGANLKVMDMMDDLKRHVKHPDNRKALTKYLSDVLDKKAFDHQGLIYGMGHAVYTLSDPRAKVFKSFVQKLAAEKGRLDDYNLYAAVEVIAPELIISKHPNTTGVSANVDFYSGFVYDMLGIPRELYTPIFATARIVGWSAHRIEEIVTSNKILRPAYVNINQPKDYVPLEKR